jgi:hypothetical protein
MAPCRLRGAAKSRRPARSWGLDVPEEGRSMGVVPAISGGEGTLQGGGVPCKGEGHAGYRQGICIVTPGWQRSSVGDAPHKCLP